MERLDGPVRHALRRSGVPDAGLLAEVTRAWPDAVGAAIARAAWPQRLGRDGTLHVTTVSSTWAFELGRMESEVRAKLAASLGDATPVALRFGEWLQRLLVRRPQRREIGPQLLTREVAA